MSSSTLMENIPGSVEVFNGFWVKVDNRVRLFHIFGVKARILHTVIPIQE